MPVYSYFCKHCGEAFDINHSIDDPLEVCPYCGEYESLNVVPQSVRLASNAAPPSDVLVRKEVQRDPRAGTGEIIKETIEETKDELRRMREEADEFEYDPRFDK